MRTQLHHLLEEGAVRFGDRPALSHQEVTLDYASAWDLASRTGAVLSGLGVARGDRVAVYLDKRPETIGGIFGASVAGGVFVPVNPALKGSQVAYILGDCDVRVLITTHQRWESVREDAKGCRELAHVLLVDAEPGAVPDEDEVRVHALSALLGDVVDPPPASRAIDVDTAAILYTSGSTGRPKGVVLSHRNLLVGAESVSTYLGNDRRRRHPGRAPAELRRRAEPGHDSVRRGRPRRAGQLPPGSRRRTPLRAPPVSPASPACRRCGSSSPPPTGRPRPPRRCATSPTRAAGCPGRPSPGCARSSRRPARS